ncbi:NACHT domain-containing protein [Nonomuraea sp. NPDC050478]|uniref:NACHT domain-containing protein n=1 Tax=Nonomuraea sp. NPDC050478 TaxID=3364365 RepID=UPI00379ECAB6
MSTEVPEVGSWVNRTDHQATRALIGDLGAGLTDLRRDLLSVATGPRAEGVRAALSRSYQALLDKPIVSVADLPPEVRMPPLAEAYIVPSFRQAVTDSAARPAEQRWWQAFPVRDDLRGFLFGYLTHPAATQSPLLVLGQPGAGKSLLTKIVAAQLPPEEFLVVRVPLREVQAEHDLQTQIESAVRQATGESIHWPMLHRPDTNTVAVIILDGFDELLQVTGVSSSDYLEKVAAFQAREAEQSRPTAVMVTSRTVVADRARLPSETVVIHLEPFGDRQIAQWVGMWNARHTGYFHSRRLEPLDLDTVRGLRELAAQPLLLTMLGRYDMDGNALRLVGVRLGRAELYERLLVRFAEREALKSGRGLPDRDVNWTVRRELTRLSVVAFAMFNRNSQWVTGDELSSDLVILLSETAARKTNQFQAPLDPGELVVGKFFFVHESQAIQDTKKRKSYEFLHSTFGEYLVARLTVLEILELAEVARGHRSHARPVRHDDDFLHALLSHAPLSARESVLEFLQDLLADLPPDTRELLKTTLLEIFRDALYARTSSQYGSYRPGRVKELRTLPMRLAVYSLNLLILLAICGGTVGGKELFPEPMQVVSRWRSLTRFWRSQVPYNAWVNLARVLDVERTWRDGERTVLIRWAGRDTSSPPDGDLYWTYDKAPEDTDRGHVSWMYEDFQMAARSLHFLCGYEEELLLHAVAPLAPELSRSLTTVAGYWEDQAKSPAHALLRMWMLSSRACAAADLADAYAECLRMSQAFAPFAETDALAYLDVVLGHLALDAARLRGVLTLDRLHLHHNKPSIESRIRTAVAELGLA